VQDALNMQMPHALSMAMPTMPSMPMHAPQMMNNTRHQSVSSDDEVQGKFLFAKSRDIFSMILLSNQSLMFSEGVFLYETANSKILEIKSLLTMTSEIDNLIL